jgi:hypothetical protein
MRETEDKFDVIGCLGRRGYTSSTTTKVVFVPQLEYRHPQLHARGTARAHNARILNAVDGCLPSDLATGRSAEIEEERRLIYVIERGLNFIIVCDCCGREPLRQSFSSK